MDTRNPKGGQKMAIVTISRQVGSLGTEIAQAVASKLQYEYLDKEKIEKAWNHILIPRRMIEIKAGISFDKWEGLSFRKKQPSL